MTPRLSVIASAIRRVISGAVSSLDPYWDKVVALIHGDSANDLDDPYWNNVALLIHGNGSNGSTTITDQKGKTVTAIGNAQISTAQGRFKGSSIYFDGSGDYLSIPITISDFTFTGDFTIEAWVYKVANSNPYHIADTRTGGNYGDFVLAINGSGQVDFVCAGGEGVRFTAGSFPTNTWAHLAFVRTNGVLTAFINGTVVSGTVNYTGTMTPATSTMYVGGSKDSFYANGYLQDLRITKGVARYTTTFNVPTAPFPNQLPATYDPFASRTVLALHMDGVNGSTTFYDQCGKTVTANGNAQISTALSKFGNSSAYFDGTGDYIEPSPSTSFDCSTNDFTVEGWVNYSGTANAYPAILSNNPGSWSAGACTINCDHAWGVNKIGVSVNNHSSSANVVTSTTNLTYGVWYHFAVVRLGTTLMIFINGVLEASATISAALTFNWGSGSHTLIGGGNWDGANSYFAGYIDDFRLTNGKARYTTTFTPPTKQFVDPVNDVLSHNPVPYGNAALGSGGVFGNCMQFDGTDDYYVIPSHTDFDFGSSDFTIEFWFKTAQTTSNATLLTRELGSGYTGGWSIQLHGNSSGPLTIYWADYSTGSVFMQSSSNTHSDSIWHHFSWVRSGNTHYMFLDGVIVASIQSSVNFASVVKNITIGNDITFGGGARAFNGYIDELRITKGVARYTTTFTPQDLPHPNNYVEADPFLANVVMHVPMMSPTDKYWDNVALLIPGNGANGSTSIFEARGKTVTVNGNAQVSTTQSKFNGSSLYFDGSGDYLSIPTSSDFALGTGDFTLEMWIRAGTVAPIYQALVEMRSAAVQTVPTFGFVGAVLVWYTAGATRIQSAALSTNTWYHVAVCRSSSVTKMFVDGVQAGSSYSDANNYAANQLLIGSYFDGYQFSGYLQDLRITKGVARYSADFTPPSKSLLAFEDKKSNALTYVGDAKLSRAQKKFTQISGYFNGTSSHVKTVSNVAANISGQDITVEGWIYLADVVGEKCICGYNNTSASDFWDLRVSAAALKFRSRASSTDTSVSGGTLVASTWTHVAVVKVGTKVTLYVNGTSVASSSALAIPNIATAQIGIGADLYGGSYWDYFNGYMQDLRITQVARYLSNFTPPVLPLPMV